MNGKILTEQELGDLEKQIDEIVARSEDLNPSISTDAEILYFDDLRLDEIITIIEHSRRKARIQESGLRLIG